MKRVKSLLCGLLLIAKSGAADARDFRVEQRPGPNHTLTMKVAEHVCPDNFEPVVLSGELDRFQIKEIIRTPPEHFKAAKTDRQPSLGTQELAAHVYITGCTFRRHFFPRTGEVSFVGDLGGGRIESINFLRDANHQEKSLSFTYTTYLKMRPDDRPSQHPRSEASAPIEAVGELWLDLGWNLARLTRSGQEDDQIQIGFKQIGLIVLPKKE